MKWHKTRCQWCPKLYASAGRYSNHIAKVHPEKDLSTLRESRSRITSEKDFLLPIGSPDIESELEGSDREARSFSNDSESDGEDTTANEIPGLCAGTPIRKHLFPARGPNYNLYAPFQHQTDYQLARFFNAAKTSQGLIDQFFKDGILKSLNPTYSIQFRSAHTMYKLVDAAASEPCWYSGTVNYPLQKGVKFRYRNIISAVKYLLRQKAYGDHMVWGPHREFDKQGNRVYSEINTATWWEDNQVSTFGRSTFDI